MFLSYWLLGLRLPTLEFIGSCVDLDLGSEMGMSVRSHSDEYSLGSEVLCWSSGLDSELPPQELWPDPRLMNQDPASHAGPQKKKKKGEQ